MTEQELAGLISNYSSQGGAFFALWITIVSGYLIAAYLSGDRLKRSQVFILNTFSEFNALTYQKTKVAAFSHSQNRKKSILLEF